VNTADGTEMWGSHYARKLADITQVQSDITRDVSKRLQIHLTGTAQQKLGRAGTTNPEAYRLYLEGRQLWYGRTPAGLKEEYRVVSAGDCRRSELCAGVRRLVRRLLRLDRIRSGYPAETSVCAGG